ncbi:small integral membrane protein 12 [Bombina bombina]|uniref:small integral membrane protein 12 n=1 Tax=Bombina bombina TaxID=8345 RepID=UPI00235B032E|nr:small integral membrane protein 12 [Bombina bombina]XP_053560780.1 small integral membrane protein 12 [Bombina bombina]XP_053560781.1 small integral membrane protein 12 [Bombina bombina]XP_053560782.1 small integral membrane protein 12 [Bombina bombina]
MWPMLFAAARTYAPYITFPVALVVGAVGYQVEKAIRGTPPLAVEEKSILEQREERTLQEASGKDLTQVVSLKEKIEFTPKAVLNRNRKEKS